MAYKIALLNEKGGEGKTVSALNIAAELANKGLKTLFLEIDPQGNSVYYFTGYGYQRVTLEQMFMDPTLSASYPTQYENLDYIPTTKNFALIPDNLSKLTVDQTSVLSQVIENIDKEYNYIIFDCLPTLNLLTTNVLRIADQVITPVTISDEGIQGLKSTAQNIEQMWNYFDSDILHRVLFTKVSIRSKDERSVMEQVRNHFDCYKQTIRYQRKPMRESSFKKKMVVNSYSKQNSIGQDYRNLVLEMLERSK